VTSTDIWISLTVFVLMYLSLGVADVYLMIHYGRQELEPGPEGGDDGGSDVGSSTTDESEDDRVPALIY
jgi:cytochrome bd-type quinol oxidase subunit 1